MTDTEQNKLTTETLLDPIKDGDEITDGWVLGAVRETFPGTFEIDATSSNEEPTLTLRLFSRDDDQGFLAQSASFNISDVSQASVQDNYFSDSRDAALKALCRQIRENDPSETDGEDDIASEGEVAVEVAVEVDSQVEVVEPSDNAEN
jgi:hypothetical protein